MSVEYNSGTENFIGQGLPVSRADYDPTAFTGALLYDIDGDIYFSNGSEWISSALESNNAAFALDANTALFANLATFANSALFANLATFAVNAQFSYTSNTALFANLATHATNAQFSYTSNIANFATLSGLASNAQFALTANNSALLEGRAWSYPGVIGSAFANAATFTDVVVQGNLTILDTFFTTNTEILQVSNSFIVLIMVRYHQ